MKDRVFIAWSGTNEVALKVKTLLEAKNYLCFIGGNSDNDSKFSSVGDTVIQQMKTCNQAIIIFQNKIDPKTNAAVVSNNLFFELGYVLSKYGQNKIHCVKKKEDPIVLPSDFDNSFIEAITGDGNDAFAAGIVEYFLKRQKMSVTENKMLLINNRYRIRDMLKSHFSESGSRCSDYELAQYILFYMQSAYLFGDERSIKQELLDFKQAHFSEIVGELSTAIDIGVSYLDIAVHFKTVEKDGQSTVYIDEDVFGKIRRDYMGYLENLGNDDVGMFDDWARAFIYDHLKFLHYLFANNPELEEEEKRYMFSTAKDYALKALECISKLENDPIDKQTHDSTGILSLMKSYAYWVLFFAEVGLGNDGTEWMQKTIKVRSGLKKTFEKGTIDTQIYNYFCMEYYLAVIKYLPLAKDIQPYERRTYKKEINEYLESVKEQDNKNAYIKQIELWYKNN